MKKIFVEPSGAPETAKKIFIRPSGLPETTKKIFFAPSGVPESTKKMLDDLSGISETPKNNYSKSSYNCHLVFFNLHETRKLQNLNNWKAN